MLEMVKHGLLDENQLKVDLDNVEHNPAMEIKDGRLKRWVKDESRLQDEWQKHCCGNQNDKHVHDLNFVYKFEAFESAVYDKLTAKKRAISNWQRLRIVLLLLDVCGGRTTETKKKHVQIDKKKKPSCKEYFARQIIDPQNKWKIAWDFFVGTMYSITLVVDPVVLSFHF